MALIVLLAPTAMTFSLFLGDGWQQPLSLFQPERSAVLAMRIWRVVSGGMVGVALAVSGALLQAVLRNPLAEPYVLGLSSGAALGTASAIAVGLAGPLVLPLSGFVGALVSLFVVCALATIRGRSSPHTLILAGVVWSSLCGSILMFLVSQSSAEGMHAVMWWFLGDLQVFDARLVRYAAAIIAAAVFLVIPRLRIANALLLGDEAAHHVGAHPERERRRLLILASLMAAAAVSVSGLIAFVGLTAPHVARALLGPDHRRVVPAAALLAAAFLTVADGVGRVLLYPIEIPVGVITAMVGAPFFLHVLRRRAPEMWA